MEFVHTSVLLQEVMEQLSIRPSGIYVDGTLGRAGHSFEICSRLEDQGRLIGFDQDGDAIKAATEHLKPFAGRVEIIRSNFAGMKQELADRDIHQVDGILLDLGVSSYQLDNQDRGFTYRYDVPLDMRMDDRQELSATTVVNEYSQKELFHIIRDYGEDRFAQNIARHIVEERQREPIRTTGRLAEIIDRSIPMKFKKQGGHPAKRTFQAIRIEVNQELRVLEEHIQEMIDLLTPGGRICIITFHSLEDRIVKNAFRTAQNPCICPPEFPVCVCGRRSKGKVLTRKPILPTEREMEENPRSKSAKLRVFEHI